jgi:hypothetical protein
VNRLKKWLAKILGVVPEAAPPLPADYRTIAQKIRDLSQIRVFLPVAREWVTIRAMTGINMLFAGIRPLMIPSREELEKLSEADKKKKWAEQVTAARHTAVAVGIEPEYSLHETTDPGIVCVRDLDDIDVVEIYRKSIGQLGSRYHGIDGNAFDAKKHMQYYLDQKEVAAFFGDLFRWFPGLDPLEVLEAPMQKIGILQEIMREDRKNLEKLAEIAKKGTALQGKKGHRGS